MTNYPTACASSVHWQRALLKGCMDKVEEDFTVPESMNPANKTSRSHDMRVHAGTIALEKVSLVLVALFVRGSGDRSIRVGQELRENFPICTPAFQELALEALCARTFGQFSRFRPRAPALQKRSCG
eukprot:2051433-Amphidinium_carterae.1